MKADIQHERNHEGYHYEDERAAVPGVLHSELGGSPVRRVDVKAVLCSERIRPFPVMFPFANSFSCNQRS